MRFAPGCARPWAVALAALCVLGACDGGGGTAGDGGVDVVAASCSWQPSAPQLTLPRSEVRGTLRGTSRNASTTCTRSKGAGGPEAIFSLRLTERMVVDLEVVSNIDTVVSVRRDCTDPLTELACNDTSVDSNPGAGGAGGSSGTGGSGGPIVLPPPPIGPFPVDAGVDAPPVSNSRDGHVRAALDPGTYFVLVDEAEAFGVGGDFVLKVSTSTPPAQSSCATALPLSDGTSLAAEQLDLASGNAISCSGGTSRPALFYRATIPSGHRLTARATPTRGDRSWTPVMQLLDSCTQTAQCLATERSTSDGTGGSMLRYVNNGPSDQTVLLAVGANGPVSGALFQLTMGIGEPHQNQSCVSARPLTDGLVLRNQDLSEGMVNPSPRCGGSGSPSLFYKATLVEGQTAEVTLQGQFDPRFGQVPFQMIVSDGCQGNCVQQLGGGQPLVYTNAGPGTRDLIIEVTSFVGMIGTASRLFDLTAKLSLPPGRVIVAPVSGLQTTEAGGNATFTVVLASPPLQPVEIALRSSDPGEGRVNPTALKFDGSNWGTPQVVTVTGVDDAERDGTQSYTVVVEKATSGDPRYAGIDGDDVQLTNRDDEPGFALDQSRPAVTSESGGTAAIPVTLNRAPTATVRLPITSSDPGEGQVLTAELVFEPTNWNQPQVIRVVGVDDAEMDGNQTYQLRLGPATSADPAYEGVDPPDVPVINTDNEYQRVAAQMISGKLECLFGRPSIGADQGGRLYVAMQCFDPNASGGGAMPDPGKPGNTSPGFPARDGGAAVDARPGVPGGPAAFVATSGDGGRTFGVPVNTGWQVSQMRVAGTTTENAVLALLGSSGAMVLRSDDAGATWRPPSMLGSANHNLRLATGGQTVVVSYDGDSGPALWTSGDGGRTFVRRLPNDLLTTVALYVDATSGAITLVGYDGQLKVRRSTDGGATFGAAAAAPAEFAGEDTVAVGPRSVFSADKGTNLSIMPLDNLNAGREVPGLGVLNVNFAPVLVADAADNVVALESTFMAMLMNRLDTGQTTFATPKPFTQVQDVPAGVALTDRAVAVVGRFGGQVMAAVEIWP